MPTSVQNGTAQLVEVYKASSVGGRTVPDLQLSAASEISDGDPGTVPVQALSGAEAALFCSALAAAVITLRGAPVRVLCVEAAECSGWLDQLLAAVAAVADGLTAAVILSPTAIAGRAGGWSVVRIGVEKEAKAA